MLAKLVKTFPRYCSVLLTLLCCGCGTVVPQVGEIWEDNPGIPADKTLEMLVKKKVFCDLHQAVYNIENEPGFQVTYQGKTTFNKWIPESWGVLMSLNITVDEGTQINPGITLNDPLKPATSFGAPFAQSFKTSINGTFSAEANRQDKFTYFYLVKDLEIPQPTCPGPPAHGSSLLLGDLEMQKWLANAMNMRTSLQTSEVSQQEVATYDIKFIVITNAGATPTWTLLRVTGSNGTGNLLGVGRSRTHGLIVTFGPTQPPLKVLLPVRSPYLQR